MSTADCGTIEFVIECLRQGRHEDALSQIGPVLSSHWRSAEVCHLAGNLYLWQALDAAEKGDMKKAVGCWNMAIPHLVRTLFNDSYLAHFASARSADYKESLTSAESADGVKGARAFIDERLKELVQHSEFTMGEFETQRLERVYVEWKLELEAAERVRCLGGVPDGSAPARCLSIGPKFAALYGLTPRVMEFLGQVQSASRSELETLIAEAMGGDDPADRAKREAPYCFSDLGLPFAYYLLDQPDIALNMLQSITDTNGDRGPLSSRELTPAAALRREASELAIRIQIALGTAELRRVQCDPQVVFDHFFAALEATERADQQAFTLSSPAWRLRQTMSEAITSRIGQLKDVQEWDRALRLAKVMAKLEPTKENVTEIVDLLVAQADWSYGKKDEHTALDCLQRAEMLEPSNQRVRLLLLYCLGGKLHGFSEKGNRLEAANVCMEILEEVRSIKKLCDDSQKLDPELAETSENLQNHAVAVLWGVLQEMPDELDSGFIARAHAYVFDVVKGGVEQIGAAEGSRLSNQAISQFNQGDLTAAYASIDKAWKALPDEPQVRQLYENLSAAIAFKLCESGDVDRAEEIAGMALERIPDSAALGHAQGRISLCRLDRSRLLSSDPEEVAKVIAAMDSRIQKDADLDEPKRQASSFVAVIDPDIRLERHLAHVNQLVANGRCAAALKLLEEQQYSGSNAMVAGYLKVRALRFTGQPEAALALIDDLSERFPVTHPFHLERGRALSQLGRFDEAEDALLDCEDSDSDDSEKGSIRFELGVNAWRAGRNEDAASQMSLPGASNEAQLESLWIHCMALRRLGRKKEIESLTAAPPKRGQMSPWETRMLSWLRGEIADEELQDAPKTPAERLEYRYWMGEMQRALGDAREGKRLLRLCAQDTSLGAHHEFQHAQALLLSGQLGGSE